MAVVRRTRLRRVGCAIFVFTVLNALWSLVGTWSISFGGESHPYHGLLRRESGVFSCQGYLVVAVRQSLFVGSGHSPMDSTALTPTRATIPWSISANMWISSQLFARHGANGILDDRPRRLFPGLLVNWQDESTRGEWYNRGIGIHWVLLSALAGVVPAMALIRDRRALRAGHCAVCGYDLRATPDRCHECGTVPAPSTNRS